MSTYFVIQEGHFTGPPNPKKPDERTVVWSTTESFGIFTSSVLAKKHWLVAMQEIKPGDYEDDFIKSLFAPFQRMGQVRVHRITHEENLRKYNIP